MFNIKIGHKGGDHIYLDCTLTINGQVFINKSTFDSYSIDDISLAYTFVNEDDCSYVKVKNKMAHKYFCEMAKRELLEKVIAMDHTVEFIKEKGFELN